MANPTPGEIDSAVPPAGVPNRGLTNDVLKRIAVTAQAGEFAASFVQRESPTTGSTMTVLQNKQNGIVVVEGGVNLAALEVQLPFGVNQRPGQIIRLVALIDVTALTFSPPSAVHNPPTELFTGDAYALQNIGTDEWVRTVG